MNIQRTSKDAITISKLDPLLCELLRDIIPSADPKGNASALERLYSSPTSGREPDFEEEWREYVQPDLESHFRSSLDLVAGDLQPILSPAQSRATKLKIPTVHLEAWLNALNQSRLTLASRHSVTEEEMEGDSDLDTPRGRAIFQIFFYGILQECFIRELSRNEAEEDDE